MRRVFGNAVVVLALFCCFPASLWAQLADSQLEQGFQAYKDARYQEAIQYFQGAASLDPQNKVAHSYLAASYTQQYIPGVHTPENLQMGQAAIEQYHIVLELDPKSLEASKASLTLICK